MEFQGIFYIHIVKNHFYINSDSIKIQICERICWVLKIDKKSCRNMLNLTKSAKIEHNSTIY